MTVGDPPYPDDGGYHVELETDSLRAAAHLLADAVATDLLHSFNKSIAIRALAGDAGVLLGNTMASLRWIKAQLDRDPSTIINLWTFDLMKALDL